MKKPVTNEELARCYRDRMDRALKSLSVAFSYAEDGAARGALRAMAEAAVNLTQAIKFRDTLIPPPTSDITHKQALDEIVAAAMLSVPDAPKPEAKPKRVISPEGRARIAAAQRKRWAKVKRGK